jgi:hypothetical protein
VVALGASNLTRGLPALCSAARAAGGPEVEIVAALGLGRSYGMESRVLSRTLPAILDCGLWRALEERPPLPTRALVTDVGNDIIYGAQAPRILEWVEEAVTRLRALTDDVVVAGLPLHSIRRLSPAKYVAFRTLIFPRCRIPFDEILATAERVADGLAALAIRHDARFVPLRDEWYGFDPIHVRPARWSAAWREILGANEEADSAPSLVESLRLHTLMPERQRLFGVEQRRPQTGTRLARGGRVWLF